MEFANALRSQPNAVVLSPETRHWRILTQLCLESDAKGNLIPGSFLAALAIESGSDWVTSDRDYSGFQGLKVEWV